MNKGQILVVSGPSGSGKSTLIQKLMKEEENIYFSISNTTREIRSGEKHGVNYYYVSEDEFKQGIEKEQFLEWALVHKNYYGTSLKPAMEALEKGKIVIFDIDVQGYNIVKEKFKDDIVSVFITTRNKKDLETRLNSRKTENKDVIEKRIMNAVGEMEHIKEYDYLIINDDLDISYSAFKSIFNSMKYKTAYLNLRNVIDDWIY
ncbi:deoxyguanylate kinase / guanylate kinase [Campylobacter blaseri]|uniref:guanylate kinase n=1 Tax=Campylobacter blaseri TaxID=2042961 RepID=UPI0026869CB0|nr:deoxyguanylate kinase / guanylate kinase [Campylobacter blaseri]